MKNPTVNMSDAVKGLTLTVTVKRDLAFRIRTRIGLALMRLAVWVMGFACTEVRAE